MKAKIIRLIMPAHVAYLFGMFRVKFFKPVCNAHRPNTSVKEKVKRTELNPKKRPDRHVTSVNDAIVVDRRDVMNLFKSEYHFVLMGRAGFFVGPSAKI